MPARSADPSSLKFDVDGEMQFDAAVSPWSARLSSGDKVAGYANTFIFPEIQSGKHRAIRCPTSGHLPTAPSWA